MGERESKMAQQKNTPNTIHSIQKGSTNKEVPIICTDLLHSVADFFKKKFPFFCIFSYFHICILIIMFHFYRQKEV